VAITQRLLSAVAAVLTSAMPAFAQGAISGAVFDPDGAPREGQNVYLTNMATRSQLDFETLENGRFEFSGLPAAEYRLTSDGPGIGTVTIALEDGERWHRDFKLSFGPFTATWTVGPPSPPLPPDEIPVQTVRPSGYRCAERLPYCGPPSLMEQFEAEEAARLKSRWLAPRLIRGFDEDYPPTLLKAGLEGSVVIEARVGTDNTLIGPRVTAADHPALGEAALALAARSYTETARIGGVPTEQPVTITVRYRLK
jgi:TonB family protein